MGDLFMYPSKDNERNSGDTTLEVAFKKALKGTPDGIKIPDENKTLSQAIAHDFNESFSINNIELEPFTPPIKRKYTVDEAAKLSKEERLSAILKFNDMPEPVAWGLLVKGKFDKIKQIHSFSGNKLLLPLDTMSDDPEIFIYHADKFTDYSYLRFHITVLDDGSSKVKKNPFSLRLDKSFKLEVLKNIPNAYVAINNNGILVSESIFNVEKKRIANELLQYYEAERKKYGDNLSELAQQSQVVETKLISQGANLRSLLDNTLETESLLAELKRIISEKQSELAKLDQRKDELMSEYKRLLDFVKERSDFLLSLDLISEEHHNRIRGEMPLPPPKESDEESLSWTDDLQKDWLKTVSAIHSYITKHGMFYPRWVIANFLTLLRTNDLIILSGLSGSGKTQLVKSFAKAIGAKSHIIPVKPNWTSSEDLIGFFNPLQHTYMKTQFLEALLDAERDPDRLHLICLDEMNLARVEYYFADFLSALEERGEPASIQLYSESEANNIKSEIRLIFATLNQSEVDADSYKLNLETCLMNPQQTEKLKKIFGENANESFAAFLGRVRRSLANILDVSPKLTVPNNARFIGAINVDQTTYSLSPKILDRAHVLRFENPLKYNRDDIKSEAETNYDVFFADKSVCIRPEDFDPIRANYPEYNPSDPAAIWLQKLYSEYLSALGIDIAYRTIRQSQLYWTLLADVFPGDRHEAIAKNLIVLQKILPKFTMDGKSTVKFKDGKEERYSIVKILEEDLKYESGKAGFSPNMFDEINRIRLAAESSDKIFNYWA